VLDAFTWFKQSSLLWRGSPTVYIDPWGITDGQPPADLILLTHAHFDHLSEVDLAKITTDGTVVVAPHDIAAQLTRGDVRAVRPGEKLEAAGLQIETVAAYNVKPDRLDFHPRDNNWVGYLVPLGAHRYYFAGDTDHTPELDEVRADVAFVPIGGTYTMDVDEAAGAIKQIRPKLAVPYHFGFVVGTGGDGERLVKAIAPIEGAVLSPMHPFEL